MADPVTIIAIVSAVATVASTAYSIVSSEEQASKAKKLANQQAETAENLAAAQVKATEDQTTATVDKLRRSAAATKSTQTAQYAGSGVDLSSDAVKQALFETDKLSEQDIATVMQDAANTEAYYKNKGATSADYYRSTGELAADKATSQSIGSVLSAVNTLAGDAKGYLATTPKVETAKTLLDRVNTTNQNYYLNMSGVEDKYNLSGQKKSTVNWGW